jgi:ABC-type antimicrobial peptide transport system permease subunit
VIVVLLLLVAAFANVLAPYPPDLTNNAVFLKPPAWQEGGSWAYPLGTDAIGRDMLSRLIHGARCRCRSAWRSSRCRSSSGSCSGWSPAISAA